MTNLKPFDLEKALAGHPVCTRDGREVTEIYYFKTCKSTCNLIVIVDGEFSTVSKEGKFYNDPHNLDARDLFLAPVKKKYYANILKYADIQEMYIHSDMYESFDDAVNAGAHRKNYIKTIEFEVDE